MTDGKFDKFSAVAFWNNYKTTATAWMVVKSCDRNLFKEFVQVTFLQ